MSGGDQRGHENGAQSAGRSGQYCFICAPPSAPSWPVSAEAGWQPSRCQHRDGPQAPRVQGVAAEIAVERVEGVREHEASKDDGEHVVPGAPLKKDAESYIDSVLASFGIV